MRVFKGLITGGFILALMVSPLWGGDGKYEKYTVKKGDTLWDISGTRLTDSFLWPKVWKENPEIKNPDLIFPGQEIKIPLYLMQRQVEVAAPSGGVPTRTGPLYSPIQIKPRHPFVVKSDILAASGFITDEIPHVGKVAGTPTGRSMVGRGDVVYLSFPEGTTPAPGTRFYTLRSYGKVEHPKTGDDMGVLVEISGVVKVTGKEAGYIKASVEKSFTEINEGDSLDNFYQIESFPILKDTDVKVHGTIVEARQVRLLNGIYDFVYIDRGSRDGVMPGNSFTIISGDAPHRPIGRAKVISAGQSTSVAMVTKSEIEIGRGDYF